MHCCLPVASRAFPVPMFCPGRRPTNTHCVMSRDTGLRKSGLAAVCPARVMFTHGGPVPGLPSTPRINAHSAIQGFFVLKWLGPGCCWAAGVLSMAPGQAGYPNASSCPIGLSPDRLWLGWKRPQQEIGQFSEGLERPGRQSQ